MKYISVCSGIEAASVAWHDLFDPLAFCEFEAFPSAVLAHHYPDAPNMGDLTQWRDWSHDMLADADILVGGTPCFTRGHLVLTDKGYRPIEDISPGDLVMTHLGRLQRVLRTGSKTAEVGELKAVGLCDALKVTADHPFLSINWVNQSTRRQNQYARVENCGEPEWTAAKDMHGKQWCALTAYAPQDVEISSRQLTDKEAMYLAGMYLGDGHIRTYPDKKKKALVLSMNGAKLAKMASVIEEADYTITHERTSVRATFHDTAFCEWLLEHFGHYSHLKRIPSWVLSHPYRADLLQGYAETDGYKMDNGLGFSTTSVTLAYGIADLLNAEGYTSSVKLVETPDTHVIEGRTVNQRDWYQVRAFNGELSRKSRVRHGYLCRAVQSYIETGEEEVFNIEVEEDNSYVVNGAVVHNCQAFSVAGLRNSLDDARGNLSLEFVRLADAIDNVRISAGKQPGIIVWENVPGVLSVKDNAFGCFLAALAGDVTPYVPPRGKWTNAGVVDGPARQVAWRILDAQYFGLAQRRRRVFVVASARDGFDPFEVLFEREGMQRNSPPRREARESTAHSTAPCLTSSGRGVERTGDTLGQDPVVAVAVPSTGDISHCLNAGGMGRQDYETETLIAHTLKGEGFDASEDDTGRGTPLVPTAYSIMPMNSGRDYKAREVEVAQPIMAGGPVGGNQGGDFVMQHGVAYPLDLRNAGRDPEKHDAINRQGVGVGEDGDPMHTLSTAFVPGVATSMAVRRLVPEECEALQGFPRGYTMIPWKKKPADQCPDGPRYKSLGNSMAVPVMRWIGQRIALNMDSFNAKASTDSGIKPDTGAAAALRHT